LANFKAVRCSVNWTFRLNYPQRWYFSPCSLHRSDPPHRAHLGLHLSLLIVHDPHLFPEHPFPEGLAFLHFRLSRGQGFFRLFEFCYISIAELLELVDVDLSLLSGGSRGRGGRRQSLNLALQLGELGLLFPLRAERIVSTEFLMP
jgi:hypothetical protein